MTLRRGLVKRIYVNRQAFVRGDPPISVRTSKGTYACRRVEVEGSSVVTAPGHQLSSGARVWIETRSEVKVWQ